MNKDMGGFKGGYIEHKNKNIWKIIVFVVLLVIAVIIGLIVGLNSLKTDPVAIYERAINKAYETFSSYIQSLEDIEFKLDYQTEPFVLSADFNIYSNALDLSNFTDYDFDVSLGLDVEQELLNLELDLVANNNHIVNFILSYINSQMYLQSTDLYTGILDLGIIEDDLGTDIFTMDSVYELDAEDLETIISEMRDILIASLDETKFTVYDEAIIVNNEIVQTEAIAYSLDSDNITRTLTFISDSILGNEELMNALARVLNVTTTELEANIARLEENDYPEVTLILYRSGNNVVAVSLVEEEEIIHFTNQDDILNLTIKNAESTLTVVKTTTNLEVEYVGTDTSYVLDLVYETDDELTFNLTMTSLYTSIINIELTNMSVSTRRFSADADISITTIENEEETTYGITGYFSLEKREVSTLDIDESVSIEDLTEEEQEELQQNLYRILDRLNLSELYQGEE